MTRVLRTAFKENKVSTLRSYQQYLPISIAGEEKSVNSVLSETLVRTMADGNGEVNYIPLNNLVTVVPAEDLKSITAGKNGEYIPLSFYDVKDAPGLMQKVKEVALKELRFFISVRVPNFFAPSVRRQLLRHGFRQSGINDRHIRCDVKIC